MALICNVSLNIASMTAGQTPPPQATLTVYNPNASAVLVTGASLFIQTLQGQRTTSANAPMVPLIYGSTTIAALGTATFGPFPISAPMAANANTFAVINPASSIFPLNPQPSQASQQNLMVGATVYGSDGSVNTAGMAPLLVSYVPAPPLNYQGGPLQFSAPNNLALGFTTGLL